MENKLTLNLSMFGEKNTGLGVYAMNAKSTLEKIFSCQIISSELKGKNIIKSPVDITLGRSRYASLKRIVYSMFFHPSNIDFVYTPTHHGFFGNRNQVITIHDLICIRFPEQHKKQHWYFKYVLPRIIKECKAVFTVSYTAKADICQYYKISEDFVHVIPNALSRSEKIFSEVRKARNEKYLLVVGAGYPHKNIHEFLKNHRYWKEKYKVKVVSEFGSYGEYLKELVQKNELGDSVEFLGFVSQKKLENLYQECEALIYPSLWEGFGIPPLEALNVGKPIVLSNIKVFKEIFENVGIYIEHDNEKTWETAFKILDNESEINNHLSERKKILEKYSWKKNGDKMMDIFTAIEPKLKDALKNDY